MATSTVSKSEADASTSKQNTTANLESTPDAFFDVKPSMRSVLLWTPSQQASATHPAGQSGVFFRSAAQPARNAITLTFVLLRNQVSLDTEVSPLSVEEISQLQLAASRAITTFIFPLNPRTMDTSKEKVRQWILSNGGFVLQTWGNDTVKMQFSGKTSALVPEWETVPGNLSIPGLPDQSIALNSALNIPKQGDQFVGGIYDTLAYKNFKLLEFYYDYFNGGNEDNRLLRTNSPARTILTLGSWGGTWEGILSNFKFKLDADSPFRIEYSFMFEAVPRLMVPTTFTAQL